MLEEAFVEDCWEDEAVARQCRDTRRAELEAIGLKCQSLDCYRITDWRRVFVVVAEPPEVEPIASLREKKVERDTTQINRTTLPRRLDQPSLSNSSVELPPASLNRKLQVKRRQVTYETK